MIYAQTGQEILFFDRLLAMAAPIGAIVGVVVIGVLVLLYRRSRPK